MEPIGPAKPAAGVMATRPATAPEAMPSSEALPLRERLDGHPGEARGGGSQDGVDQRKSRAAGGLQVRAGVEAEPADPQQAGADEGQGQRVRSEQVLP